MLQLKLSYKEAIRGHLQEVRILIVPHSKQCSNSFQPFPGKSPESSLIWILILLFLFHCNLLRRHEHLEWLRYALAWEGQYFIMYFTEQCFEEAFVGNAKGVFPTFGLRSCTCLLKGNKSVSKFWPHISFLLKVLAPRELCCSPDMLLEALTKENPCLVVKVCLPLFRSCYKDTNHPRHRKPGVR